MNEELALKITRTPIHNQSEGFFQEIKDQIDGNGYYELAKAIIEGRKDTEVNWKCNCPYCLDGCSQDVHNKKFIAEAIAIHSHIDWNKIPKLREILVSRPPQNTIWLELVFLLKEVIENKIALTEIISHASINLIKNEWSKIADYLEKRAKEYRRNARKAKKEYEADEASVWEGVAEDLEACAYVIDKGMHWNTQ